MKYLTVFLLLALFSLPLFGQSEDIEDVNLHLYISELKQAAPPTPVKGKFVFSYNPEEVSRHVGIAFSFDNYRNVRAFLRNQHGIFFYIMTPPENTLMFEYRLIVDGTWMADPTNREYRIDDYGIRLSRLSVPQKDQTHIESPIVRRNYVEFTYKAEAGKRVYITGSFNNWDPYMYPMAEIMPGIYSRQIRLLPGKYHYYYLKNGERDGDPLNPQVSYNSEGFKRSVLVVPSN